MQSPSARMGSDVVNPFVRWAFYAFVLSIPFETIDLGIPLELTSIVGVFLLLSTILQPHLFLRMPSKAFWCFGMFLYVSVITGMREGGEYRDEVAWRLFVLFQLMILCWISYNVMRYHHVARGALLVLVAACTILSILQLTGITETASDVNSKIERVTAMGFHPNNIARILALGLLALVGLTYGQDQSAIRPRVLVWLVFALVGVTIVQTGSRGGLLALGVGLLAFVLKGGTTASKVRNSLVVFLGIGFFVLVSYQSEATRARFQETLENRDLARRDQIFPLAWRMFKDRPMLGWGPVNADYELGARLLHPEELAKNPHNLFLYILVTTGLIGTIPMLLGIWISVRLAWEARAGPHGILPFAMLAAVLAANMSGLWLFNKLHWIVFAYALASGSGAIREWRSVAPPKVIPAGLPTVTRGYG